MRLDGVWWLEDRLRQQLRPVPFEVPPGVSEIEVRLEYDQSAGAVLDLGCAGPEGFRGWSGGARESFRIGVLASTPGYLAGEILPGVWHVWLGLHRVPPEGVRYSLEITFSDKAAKVSRDLEYHHVRALERPPARELPTVGGRRWYAGDLHAHTEHSDGKLTVRQLATLAAEVGLDFLAVTDHNTISHYPFLEKESERSGVTLIPGQEVTTDLGHANVWGSKEWIDFRRPASQWMKQAEKAGALFSVNHPLAGDCAWRHQLTTQPSIAEIWHWSWFDRTWGWPLAWMKRHPAAIIPVGGSDFHEPDGLPASLGEPVTWVLADECETPAILSGIAAGRTAVSATRTGPLVLRCGDEVTTVDADGLVLVRPDETRVVVRADRAGRQSFPASQTGVYRLETWRNEVVALCA
ncbi:CehA/McbA family metallohydrolase [Catenulispora rubra]|uniref:CehA/McbA family metallohydrolase n=1 Tax=Catenulispora rubra TaxID=280293 RepID=UPI00189236D2|nr:CehA/McbA family metallohydrolase [Catenulispora rubra]